MYSDFVGLRDIGACREDMLMKMLLHPYCSFSVTSTTLLGLLRSGTNFVAESVTMEVKLASRSSLKVLILACREADSRR